MIIAIPSVTRYIAQSRDDSYIVTAKEYISTARNMINTGKYSVYDTTTTYYIPTKCLKMETGGDSPYGKFEKAYVLVTYNGTGFDYYFGGYDEAGVGLKITKIDKLTVDRLKRDMHELDDTVAVDGRYTITKMDEETCDFETAQFSNNYSGEIELVEEVGKYTITNTYNIHKSDVENVTSYYKEDINSTTYSQDRIYNYFVDRYTNYAAVNYDYNDSTGKRQMKKYLSVHTIFDNTTSNQVKITHITFNGYGTYKDISGDINYSYSCEKDLNGNELFVELNCKMNTNSSFGICNENPDYKCFKNERGFLLYELDNGDIIRPATYVTQENRLKNNNVNITQPYGGNSSVNIFSLSFDVAP